ncbi:hypothetical protein [Brucella intermedia]|uniref:hypothetical protein n=1 Tax=Brucella intermedia TaxID=94625 RepID=UPI00224B0D95|nr:hypothetical protein [Brucella intermedia]
MTTENTAKGEERLKPVDVDVLDNLINAEAAYIAALTDTLKHFEIDDDSQFAEENVTKLLDRMASAKGHILTAIAVSRV